MDGIASPPISSGVRNDKKSMTFPLYYFLIPYVVFLIIYLIFILIDIYHLALFSSASLVSFSMTVLFLTGVVYVLFWTWTLGQPIDWKQMITIFKDVYLTPIF